MPQTQKLLFITFAIRGTEVRGRVTGGLAPGEPDKVAFIDGYSREFPSAYRGFMPAHDEEWVCQVVRDTRPGQRIGAFIVVPARPSRWEWLEVGEPVLGEREWRPTCLDDPARSSAEAPFTQEQVRQKNAAFARALERKKLLDAPFASAEGAWALAATLGPPESSHAEGSRIFFDFEGGARASADPRELAALGWPCRAARWERRGDTFLAHLEVPPWTPRFTEGVARVRGCHLEVREPWWSHLGPGAQLEIFGQLRAEHPPEAVAERDHAGILARHPDLLGELAADLLDMQRPGACSLTPVADKPGWWKLWTGGRNGRPGVFCGEVSGSWKDAEACRRQVLEVRRRQAAEDLAADPTPPPRFFSAAEWEPRYSSRRRKLAADAIARAEVEASVPLAKLRAAEADYENACDEARLLQAEIDSFWMEALAAGATRWDLPSEARIPPQGPTAAEIRGSLEPARQWLRAARQQLAARRSQPQVPQQAPARGSAALTDLQKKFNRRK